MARGLLGLAVLAAVAIAGYMLIEGWSFLDAAYMTVVTFTTVGYEEVRPPLFNRARLHHVPHGGLRGGNALHPDEHGATDGGAGSAAKPGAEAQNEVAYGKTERALHRIRFGRVGRAVALTLQEQSAAFVVIDRDTEVLTEAEACGMLWVHGDSTQDENLLAARLLDASGLVAATGDDSHNVYVSLTARGLNPDLYIVARASRPDAAEKLRRAGADEVILPHVISRREMALSAMAISVKPTMT